MNNTDAIYEEIKNRIIERTYLPGYKFNQRKLSEEFNVSRTPIVKVLNKLSEVGLLDTNINKGFWVHKLNLKELSELYIIREALEVISVKDLATRKDEKCIQELESYFSLDKNIDDYKLNEYRSLDMKFHNAIINLSTNIMIKKINDSFQILNRTYTVGLLRTPLDTYMEHINIIQAIKRGDIVKSTELVSTHLNITKNYILKTITELEAIGIDCNKISVEDVVVHKK